MTKLRYRSGQSATELALIIPFIVGLLLVVSDYSRVFFMSIEVNNAAQAGAMYGIQSVSNAQDSIGMQTAASNDGSDIAGLTSVASNYCVCNKQTKFTCGKSPACGDQARYVEVDTSATFHTLISYPGLPTSIALSGKAIMRVQ